MPEPPIDIDSLLEREQLHIASSLLDQLPLGTEYAGSVDAFIRQADSVSAFKIWRQQSKHTKIIGSKKIGLYLSQCIAQLDQIINDQINAVLHHEKFQRLEASWRGLSKLVGATNSYNNVKVRLLDISWREISKDIARASDFDQSALFNLIYSQEFGMAGGQPFGTLIGDYAVSHRPSKNNPYDDVATLRGIAQIAAAAFAPFICSGSPQLFGLDRFETLGNPINFDAMFKQTEYTAWRSLREMEDTRFIAITLPQVLMRKPYLNKVLNTQGLLFNENVSYKDNRRYLWGNACYAMGIVLIREFGDVGWFSHIRGAPRDHLGGGLVTNFPSLDYGTDSEKVAQKIMTQVVITDSKERILSDHGFLTLCDCYDTPFAAFQSCPSLHKTKVYSAKSVTANARMAAMLQQVLCASRFAHYIKIMIRDKIGSFTSDIECERLLQDWLNKYTTGRDDLDWNALARFPLQSARVQVREIAGKPGTYSSIIHLKPHYIIDQLVSELRFTTELNQSGFTTIT